MPTKHAAFKHLRQTKKRTAQNKQVKNAIRTLIKATRKAIVAKEKAKATDTYHKAAKALDKAAQKKIIARNKAARLKSRLSKQIHQIA